MVSAFVLAIIAVEADARNYLKHFSSNELREVFGYNDLDFLFDAPSDIKLIDLYGTKLDSNIPEFDVYFALFC